MVTDPTLAVMFIIGLDVIIVAILIVFLYRNEMLRSRMSGNDVETLQQLKASMKDSIDESSRSSEHLLQAFEQKLHSVQEMYAKIEHKEAEVQRLLDRVEKTTSRVKSLQPHERRGTDDAYTTAARLLAGGCAAEDVQKTCGISLAEIDLIAHIVRSTASQ
jgi:predicted nuclease with TOPRIM domain